MWQKTWRLLGRFHQDECWQKQPFLPRLYVLVISPDPQMPEEKLFPGMKNCPVLSLLKPARSPKGRRLKSFQPEVSKRALKKMVREVRRMKIHRWTNVSIEDIARTLNPKIRGWINYYGKFRKARLKHFLHRSNVRLLKWIQNKHKRFRYRIKAAKRWLKNVYKPNPCLFAHWSFGVRLEIWMAGAV